MAPSPPDLRLRKARNLQWEHDHLGVCARCQQPAALNVLDCCQGCNFQAKLPTLTVVAEPWALKEVRRQYGHAGESDRRDQQAKARRARIEEETGELYDRRAEHAAGA